MWGIGNLGGQKSQVGGSGKFGDSGDGGLGVWCVWGFRIGWEFKGGWDYGGLGFGVGLYRYGIWEFGKGVFEGLDGVGDCRGFGMFERGVEFGGSGSWEIRSSDSWGFGELGNEGFR